jgi:Putative neutral zinc metallopeptidase
MRFRRRATLDPGQVTDVRGRRMGRGGLALGGGGGLGLAGVVVYLLFALLSGGGGGLGQLGLGDTPGEVSQECRTGEDANERQDCRIVGVVNSVQKFWDGVFQRSRAQYPYADTVFFTDQVQAGCGLAGSEVGPCYCPRDQRVYIDLGFFDELQSRFGAGGAPCPGLRDRARVRPPRPEPARRARAGRERPPGAREPRRALGAAGRLLRGRVGGQRRLDRAGRAADAVRHQRRPRRCDRHRRRPHPAADAGPGQPGDVDARLLGATAPLVLARLRAEAARRLRHFFRLDLER